MIIISLGQMSALSQQVLSRMKAIPHLKTFNYQRKLSKITQEQEYCGGDSLTLTDCARGEIKSRTNNVDWAPKLMDKHVRMSCGVMTQIVIVFHVLKSHLILAVSVLMSCLEHALLWLQFSRPPFSVCRGRRSASPRLTILCKVWLRRCVSNLSS